MNAGRASRHGAYSRSFLTAMTRVHTLQAPAKAAAAAIAALSLALTVSACDGSAPPDGGGARLTSTRPVAPIGGDPLPGEEVGRAPLRPSGGSSRTPTVPHAPAEASSPGPSTPSLTHPQSGAPAIPPERIQTGSPGPPPLPEVEVPRPRLPITPLPLPPERVPLFPHVPKKDTYVGPPGPRGACHCSRTTQQLESTEAALGFPSTSRAMQTEFLELSYDQAYVAR